MAEHLVTKELVEIVGILHSEGDTTTRMRAAELLRARGWDEPVVVGMLAALTEIPGVRSLGSGQIALGDDCVTFAQFRQWRFALGRVDLSDAIVLLAALSWLGPTRLTPKLKRLFERLVTATAPLLEEAKDG